MSGFSTFGRLVAVASSSSGMAGVRRFCTFGVRSGGGASGGGCRRRLGCASGRPAAAGPPTSSPAAGSGSLHGSYAGRRRVLLAVGDGHSAGRLGRVDRPQAVCPDGECAGVSRLHLSQLGPQGLREALHEEAVLRRGRRACMMFLFGKGRRDGECFITESRRSEKLVREG